MQVYAVFYEASGRFLIGYKFEKGYFFYTHADGGIIVPAGQKLNGGLDWALPGGRREGQEAIDTAALREFKEETAAAIVPEQTANHEFSLDYAAAYFRVDDKTFNETCTAIGEINLPSGINAQKEIIEKEITRYAEIHVKFPEAPQDNELRNAYIWDVKDSDCWNIIVSWKNNRKLCWYFEILNYYKNNVLLK